MTYLKSLLVSFLGSYNPIIYVDSLGNETVQYDIEYIATVIIFCIVLFSTLKIIGAIICKQ